MLAGSETPNTRLDRLKHYLTDDPENLNLLAEVADLTLAEGKISEARAVIHRALAVSPKDPFFRSRLSSVALAEQNWDEAITISRELLAAGEDAAAIHYNLGRALLFAERYAEAREEFELLFHKEGVPADVPQLLIRALHYLGKVKEAIQIAEQRLQKHPDDHAIAGMLGLLHVDNSDLKSAKSWADKALTAEPRNLDALLAIGTVQLGAEQDLPARETFESVLKVHGKNSRALVGLALAKLLKLDLAGARADFEQAVEVMPTDIGTRIGLGWVQFLLGDIPAAESSFRKVVSLNRYVGEGHGALAIIAATKGNWDEAEDLVTTALVFDAKCFSGLLAQNLLQKRAGKGEKAQAEIDRFFRERQAIGGGSLADMLLRVTSRNQSKR